jgi:diguanylate cyclase (GGDEF)-like protein
MNGPEKLPTPSISGIILGASDRVRQREQDLELALEAAKRLEREAEARAEEAERRESEAIEQSYVDQLTQCLNRNYFIKFAEENFDPIRDDGKIGLVYIDIDNFKLVNDALGHDAGDEMLQEFARLLKTGGRKTDNTVVRLGGDEFAIIWKNSSKPETATEEGTFEDHIKTMMDRMVGEGRNRNPPIEFSYGVAVYDAIEDKTAPKGRHQTIGLRGLEDVSLLTHTLIRADNNMYTQKSTK